MDRERYGWLEGITELNCQIIYIEFILNAGKEMFTISFTVQRDPKKRKVKLVEKHLIQVDFGLEDSEDDSDFEVGDQKEGMEIKINGMVITVWLKILKYLNNR